MFRTTLLAAMLTLAVSAFAQGPVPPAPTPAAQQQDVKSAPTTPTEPNKASN